MRQNRSEPTITRLMPRQFLLLLLAPLLLWPAIVNGGAFFFPDTPTYVRGMDALAVRVLGRASDWTTRRTIHVARPTVDGRVPATVKALPGDREDAPVLTGRSPFYGALAYLGVLFGSFWWVIALQALAVMAVLIGVMRHAVDPARRRAFGLAVLAAVAVATLTPLPYFTALLMPDIFAGLAIVAAAALLAGWRRETRPGRIGWIAVAGYGALSHSATTLILSGMIGVAALLWALRRRIAPAAIGAVAVAALLGIAGDAAFAVAVRHMTGHPPIRPPFVTARLTADGVGTDYLRAHCGVEHWRLCRYRDRLPLHSDSFLWSADPRNGVFSTIPPADARALSAEQGRFMLAVLRERPLEALRSSSAAILAQLTRTGLEEFHYAPEEFPGFAAKMPDALVTDVRRTGAYRGAIPVALVVTLTWPFVVAGLLLIGWAWRQPALRHQATLGLWMAFAWVVNNAVCGALSTPHDRYNMRVIWMLPLAAAIIVAAAVAQRRRVAARVRTLAVTG